MFPPIGLLNALEIAEIGPNSKPSEHFARIKIHLLVQRSDCSARRLHGFGVFPFDDGDEVEFTRARRLFEDGVFDEPGLRSEEAVGSANLLEKLLAGLGRYAEFINSVYSCLNA